MSLFKINKNLTRTEEKVEGSTIYYFEDFYENPEEVLNFLLDNPAPLWKSHEKPSFNGVHFEDRRLEEKEKNHKKVSDFFGNICQQTSLLDDTFVRSNQTRFFDTRFNDFEKNYWYPHKDGGYTALIYLNRGDTPGTNLYRPLTNPPAYSKFFEHLKPWVNKENWYCIKTLESSFNRAVLFDCRNFDHVMSITDKRFFNEWRINQVLFFNGG
jgi:hypothetical protein